MNPCVMPLRDSRRTARTGHLLKGRSAGCQTDDGVLGLFYYAWLDSREGFAVYRCDHLTEIGRLALAPF
jgi:hypothetical protein